MAGPTAPWRIGVDVGGTFTDLVLVDAAGATWVAKVPSVPADPTCGVIGAVERIAVETGLPTEDVLAGCNLFVHGSTVATNTMIEGTGARVGLITTQGFRDVIEIRRGLRPDQWNHRAPYAPVLVPRYLRTAIDERVDADGSVHRPVDLDGLTAITERFAAEEVEAIAVAFMNSYANPAHELAVAGALAAHAPNMPVTTSAEVSPLMGEYERTSTAVVNAALMPRVGGYLATLERDLAALGLARPPLLVQSNGGTASVAQLRDQPVNLLLSGPAAAVGALQSYSHLVDAAAGAAVPVADRGNLISMEIGGTSCDVLLMAAREVDTKDDIHVAGYHVSTPAIDIHTIGAGGGTIAAVDAAGMLVVGPEGAGADPGPACYGRGGTRPTVTDAHLILGRLRPGKSAGGTLDLDLDAAVEAVRVHVAEPLGLSVHDAAAGIIELTEQHLLSAVEHISIERGHAPHRFTLVAAGGAGPMHGAAVAGGLGCTRVYVPRDAGALCAIGMLHADIRQDFTKVLVGSLDDLDAAVVAGGFAELEQRAMQVMADEGFGADQAVLSHELELHHPGQIWSVRVRLDDGRFDPAAARRRFEQEYQRLYGHVQHDGTILVASLRLTAAASPGSDRRDATAAGGSTVSAQPAEPLETRPVWFRTDGWVDAGVYDGADVGRGAVIAGPALIEELTTTVVLRPGDRLTVDTAGNFMIDLRDGAAQRHASVQRHAAPVREAQDTAADARLDPVILALMQNRLDQITRHMGWVMTRTARSTIFSQSHDFSCFITTPNGTLVANADGIPIHTGGGGFAVRAVLNRFDGRIEPDDVFLLSDPYVAGGNHLPDWVIARPIFVDDALVGFCCNRAHQNDIGGGLAGTYNPEATEIWQEGIRLPVLKLIERGVVRDDLWELLLINCRTPELLDGDLLAMIGSTRIGGERVAALVEELGSAAFDRYLGGVLDHAEARMRLAIAELPDGVYEGEDHTDNDCFVETDVAVRVTLTVAGDSMTVDFTGTDGQIAGFKNSSVANTWSSVFLAVSSFFDTSIPRNEGTYRPVHIIAPEGTIVNARPPAPMTMNTVFVAHEIVIAVWQALAKADPSRACAAWSKTMHGHVAGTRDDGTTWVMYHWHAMGTPGATAERDGFAQMGHLISLGGLDIPNLEFHEQMFDVRYVEHEQRCDNAGPGLRRGGTGVRYVADVLRPATWSFRAEGMGSVSGHGVRGGGDGGVGLEWIQPVGGDEFVPPKYGVRRLGPSRMIAETPGGGGWGDPFEREPALVWRDVRDGVVSPEAAARDYGVVIAPDGSGVDHPATLALRSR